MKINAVIFAEKKLSGISKIGRKENKLLVLTIILSVAVASGVVLYIIAKDKFDDSFSEIFINYTHFITKASKSEMFSGLLAECLLYFIIALLFSTSIVGKLLVYTVSCLKIMSLSSFVTYLYSVYQLKGIEFSLLIFLPGKLIMILSMLLLINCCSSLIDTVIIKKSDAVKENGNFVLRVFIVFLLFFAVPAVDLLSATLFSKLFVF